MEKAPIDKFNVSVLLGYQVLLFILLPVYIVFVGWNWPLFTTGVILYMLCAWSVTTGYHRLYSHKAYEAHPVVQVPLLFFGTLALEMSALKWSDIHRTHHRYTDQEKDPHNIHNGFMYAHMYWMFRRLPRLDKENVADLLKNKLLVFQHKYYLQLVLLFNFIIFGVAGFLTGDYFGAFVFTILMRMFFTHHVTWFINSLAHTFGAKTFAKEITAVNNAAISLVTFGEGYHNYHHVFASDYRNGVKWYQFDPTKWTIWTLSKLGLAKNLKRTNDFAIKKAMIRSDKQMFLEGLEKSSVSNKELLMQKVNDVSDAMSEKLTQLSRLAMEYKQKKKEKKEKSELLNSKKEMKILQKSFKGEWKSWLKLSDDILKALPSLKHQH